MKWCFCCEFSDNIIARTWFVFNWCFGIRIFDVKCPNSSFYFYELNVNVLNRNKMSKRDKKFENHYKAKFLAKIWPIQSTRMPAKEKIKKTHTKWNKSKQFFEKWFKSSVVAALYSTMTSIMNLKYAHISNTITKPFCSVSKMPEASHHKLDRNNNNNNVRTFFCSLTLSCSFI